MTGVKMIYGPNATVESVVINRFEEQMDALNAAGELGRKIAKALQDK